jgi:hypothetical protein
LERHEVEFIEMAADWAANRGVVITFSRTVTLTWQAILHFKDTLGAYESQPILSAHDQRKHELPEERRQRIYRKLAAAAAAAHAQRMVYNCKRPVAGAKA